MHKDIFKLLKRENDNLDKAGLYKREMTIKGPQGPYVMTKSGRKLINFTGLDFLGLSVNTELLRVAQEAMSIYGIGVASPRLLSGTHSVHTELEDAIGQFFSTEQTMVLPTGYQANQCVFEPLFNEQDTIFCDSHAHPSLIDGMRISEAQRFFYRNCDMNDLEDKLKRSAQTRYRIIVTDGVYPLDGSLAPMDAIVSLAARYDALVLLNDTLGVGILGESGRGTAEHFRCLDKIDLITGSFGTVLGGFPGGYVTGNVDLVNWLRQRARPYHFSTAISPAHAAAARAAFGAVDSGGASRRLLLSKVKGLMEGLGTAGLTILGGQHPLFSVLTEDALTTQTRLDSLLQQHKIYAAGFCYPVVPKEMARIRFSLNLSHSDEDISKLVSSWESFRS